MRAFIHALLLLPALPGALALMPWSLHGQDADQDRAEPEEVVVTLTQQHFSQQLRSWDLQAEITGPFAREPELSPQGIVRARVRSPQSTNGFGLIWFRNSGKLYFDANQNDDLTDDPGPLSTETDPYTYQVFRGVRIPSPSVSSPVSTFDLQLGLLAERLYASALIHTIWSGTLDLGVGPSQVAILHDPFADWATASGRLLVVRPTDRSQKTLNDEGEVFPFSRTPRRLFMDGMAWTFGSPHTTAEASDTLQLPVVRSNPTTGDVRLGGTHVDRLILYPKSDDGYTVIMNSPSRDFVLPEGEYGHRWVQLKGNSLTARPSLLSNEAPLSVSRAKVAALPVGGPLNNSVTVTQRGSWLTLNYQLIGAGDGTYELTERDLQNPPRVEIFHDGKSVARGRFEYG